MTAMWLVPKEKYVRGRKPLPDTLKVLKGTDQPSRMNPEQPQAGVDQLQFVPEELSEKAQKHWAKIRPQLVESGVINNLDRYALMALCEAWATFLEAMTQVRRSGILVKGRHGEPVRNPYLKVVNESTAQLTKLFAEFGMTPSSRQRVVSSGRQPSKGGAFDDV